jgi:aminoglycoside phosphotransferase (APT) family kinase protein
MHERPRWRDRARTALTVARLSAAIAWERVAVRSVGPGTVPPSVGAITPAWMTEALCASAPEVRVTGVQVGGGSEGTSVRRQLLVEYSAPPSETGLPENVFAKTTPSLVTRMANGLTGVSAAEAGFYRELRPLLELEAPIGYHSAFDTRSFRSIHLLEDLVVTKASSFCSPADHIDEAQACDIVDALARLHGTFLAVPARLPGWLRSYAEWWEVATRVADIHRYHLKGFEAAGTAIDQRLRARGELAWQAFKRSVALHYRLPATLLHNDVHLGNWYVTGDGAMGLCDWQCVVRGHWSRDLAYALASTLRVDDRRAWERGLVNRYVERLSEESGVAATAVDAWKQLPAQFAGALLMWTPTYSPPRFFPDMQPRETAAEMLHRITTAMADHGSLDDV